MRCIVCSQVISKINYTPGSNVCHNCTDLIIEERKFNEEQAKKYKPKRKKKS